MTSIGELLPRAARLKYELEVQLRAVEAGAGDASDCSMGLQELQNQISTLRQLLDSERPERRALWKARRRADRCRRCARHGAFSRGRVGRT